MQTIRRRFLQVSVIVLALTMLGIYVVRSQQAQGAAAKPTSRSWQPANPRKQAIISPGSKSAPVIATKRTPDLNQSNVTNLLGRPLTKYEAEALNDTNLVLVGRTMMPGSKSGQLALVFSNRAALAGNPAPVSIPTGSFPNNQVATTNSAPRPMMPGSKSAGVFPGASPTSKSLPELPLKSPKAMK